MVINLRVKTLDSQDHEFSVEDDVSFGLIICFNIIYRFVEHYTFVVNVVVSLDSEYVYSKTIKKKIIQFIYFHGIDLFWWITTDHGTSAKRTNPDEN